MGTRAQRPSETTRSPTAASLIMAVGGIASLAFAASVSAATPPPWVAAITPGTWAAISLNTMADVDPALDSGLNPRAPNRAAWSANEGQRGVLDDWTGGAFASGVGTHGALLTFGGGHAGYYGSEVYAFDLGTQRWRRVTNPYTGPFNWPFTNGTYPDGSPVPTHTYDYVDYHPGTNSFVVLRGVEDGYRSTNATSRFVTHMLDLDTGSWRRSPVNSPSSLPGGGSSCYDRNRDVFWIMTPGTSRVFAKFDPKATNADGSAGRYTNYPGDNLGIDVTADCDPARDLFVYANFRYEDRIYARDLKDPTAPRIAITETGDVPNKEHAGGWAWSEKRQGFLYWRRGAGVFAFSPESGSATAWRWTNLTATGNAVAPPEAEADNGVYSRFRVANFGTEEIALVVNRIDGPVYAFRIPSEASSSLPVTVSLSASPRSLSSGETTTLSWSSTNASSCLASGGWSGSRPTSGQLAIGPITTTTSYVLDCSSATGSSNRTTVVVSVTGQATSGTNGIPSISGTPPTGAIAGQPFQFTPSASDPDGDPLRFLISGRPTWASFDATTGRLAGLPPEAGTSGPITITVSDGTQSASLPPFVLAIAPAAEPLGGTITWEPPTTRADGLPLDDLAGYNIYYGTASRAYATTIRVSNPGLTSYYVDGLAPGTYYFAVTGFDRQGNESALSTEAVGTLRRPSSTGGTSGSDGSGDSGGDTDGSPADPDLNPSEPLTASGAGVMSPLDAVALLLLAFFATLRRGRDCEPTHSWSYGMSSGQRYREAVQGPNGISFFAPTTIITALAMLFWHPAAEAASPADSDFQARCGASGVTLCVGFDDASTAVPNATLFKAGDGRFLGSIDTSVKASGGGSLRFEIPSNSGQNSSGYWLGDLGASFGQNSHFYVQWRQRLSRTLLETRFDGGSGWKQIILHRDGPSCANVQVVILNGSQRGVPTGYSHCGDPDYAFRYTLANGDTQLQQGDFNCLRRSLRPEDCAEYRADEWLTFYLDVEVGAFGQPNSRVQAYIAYEGAPLQKFIDMQNYTFAFDRSASDTFRKIQLTPYHTGKNSAQAHPTAFIWYDEVIVSRQPIAAPSSTSAPPLADDVPPAPPQNVEFQQ